MGCGQAPIRTAGSAEKVLHDLGETALLLDLDFPGAADPLLARGAEYYLGSRPMVPHDHYNGLIFLETSPKMTPTRWVPCH